MCARAPSGRPRHAMTCSPRPCVRTRIQPSFSVSNRRVYMCAESEYRSPRLFDHGRAAPRRKEAGRRCIAGSRSKRSAFPAVRRVRDVGGAIGDQYSVGCGRARAAPMFGEGYLQNASVHSYRHEGTSLRSISYTCYRAQGVTATYYQTCSSNRRLLLQRLRASPERSTMGVVTKYMLRTPHTPT